MTDLDGRLARGNRAYQEGRGETFPVEHGDDFSRMGFANTYGDSWSRPGLDFRTKTFVTLALAAYFGNEHQLSAHLQGARHQGITKDEIDELLIHLLGYIGAPKASLAREIVE